MRAELPTTDNAADVQNTWREIQDVVQHITRLSRASVSTEQFFAELLDGSLRIMAAIGGAIWLRRGESLELEYQINLSQTGVAFGAEADDDPEASERHLRHMQLLNHIAQQTQPRAISPNSGGASATNGIPTNPTDLLLLVCPIAIDEQVLGLLEVFQRPDVSPATCQGFLKFLGALSEVAADFIRNSRLRDLQEKASLWSQFERFTERVHDGLDVERIAYVIANDGRQLIHCDRIMVAQWNGTRPRVIAVTGLDSIDRRSNVVRSAEELLQRVLATQRPFWFDDSQQTHKGSADDLPPQLDKALHQHLDVSPARTLAVLPLTAASGASEAGLTTESKSSRAPILGAILIETFSATDDFNQLRYRSEVVAKQGGAALANATTHTSLPFLPIIRVIGKLGWHLRLRQLPRTVLVLGVIAAIGLALALIPADFTIDGRGELQPAVRRGVFAATDGIVAKISDKLANNSAATVEADEILIELTNSSLDFDLTRVVGDLQTTRQKLNSTNIERLTIDRADPKGRSKLEQLAAAEQELEETIKSLEAQLAVLKRQQGELRLRSPIAGQVLTWDATQLLQNRPVRQGDRLLEVANVQGDWSLEIRIADRNIGYVNAARQELKPDLDVSFVLATDPETIYHGRVKSVATDVRSHEDIGPSVLVTVSLPHDAVPENVHLRPGATVIPHIHCGLRPIGIVWFHEFIHTLYTRVFF